MSTMLRIQLREIRLVRNLAAQTSGKQTQLAFQTEVTILGSKRGSEKWSWGCDRQ